MISTIVITVLFSAVSLMTYRVYHFDALQEQGRMAAEMIRLAVTHEMDEGNPEHKNPYVESLIGITSLKSAHIIPSKQVVEQMAIDTSGRDPVSDVELKVIETGSEYEEILYGENDIRFHYTIPYVASSGGKTNCLNCHDVAEGTILGAVSLEIDVTGQFYAAIRNTVGIVFLFVLFGFALAIALRRLLKPVDITADELKHTVSLAESGNFSSRITKYSDDEMGEIADRTNHFMDTLENSIGSIANDVDTLMSHHQFTERDNLLNTTVSVVNTMAMVSRFKQVIENDRTLEDVYERFQALLRQQFKLTRYSFYELSEDNNSLIPVFNSGLAEGEELWCTKEITENCDYCRASRTALLTSSLDEMNICPSFNPGAQQDKLYHVCMPMILSGKVGGILQLVFSEEEKQTVSDDLPVLQAFIHEAAPVIESKRLMKSLKDSSLRDPMTNLYNRRFLDEYLSSLTGTIKRRKSQIGVVMCDIDHFKMVNDTYGHEIGDDVLKGACSIITNTIRNSDIAIRFGGEEFLILLLDSTEEGSLMVADRIRIQLEAFKFKTSQGDITKTMSLGVSMFTAENEDFWAVVKQADVALYQAKNSGRNQVIRYIDGMKSED
ncbi:diguanylate cyclase [Mariprofundus micogutta]|nr:diguanylate cyclase [Mariprofundus micogutta]